MAVSLIPVGSVDARIRAWCLDQETWLLYADVNAAFQLGNIHPRTNGNFAHVHCLNQRVHLAVNMKGLLNLITKSNSEPANKVKHRALMAAYYGKTATLTDIEDITTLCTDAVKAVPLRLAHATDWPPSVEMAIESAIGRIPSFITSDDVTSPAYAELGRRRGIEGSLTKYARARRPNEPQYNAKRWIIDEGLEGELLEIIEHLEPLIPQLFI